MWYIILSYIVIFKLPVSANAFQFHSVADMTNILRTKVMQPTVRGRQPPVQGQLLPNYQLTTCITIEGRYEGGIFKKQEKVCNTVPRRRPGPRRPAPQGMIKHQVMLPKKLGHIPLANHKPQFMARTPRQVMMRPLIRASLRPTQGVKREPTYHANEGNRDYQDYQIFPQATNPDNGNRDHQEYPPLLQTTNVDTGNHQEYELLPQAANQDNAKDHQEYPSLPNAAHPIKRDHQDYPYLPQAAHAHDQNRDHNDYQYDQQAKLQFTTAANSYLGQQEFKLLPRTHGSTSTSAPVPDPNAPTTNDPSSQNTSSQFPKSTTSTMPPYPGGLLPSDHPDAQPKVCAGKAKCNQFVWTTIRKSKPTRRPTKEFLLWTP